MSTRISLDDAARLVDLALRVRRAQRRYFRTRAQADLIESKQAEANLDALLAKLSEDAAPRTAQLELQPHALDCDMGVDCTCR